jgi:ribosome-associated protein
MPAGLGTAAPWQPGVGALSPQPSDTRRLAFLAAQAADEKHAEQISILDLRALSGVTDYFVVCTASSVPQVAAIQEQVERTLGRAGSALRHAEGMASSAREACPGGATGQLAPLWVLLDFGSVVVHVMDERTRNFYQLERLWGDAPRIDPTAAVRERGSPPG